MLAVCVFVCQSVCVRPGVARVRVLQSAIVYVPVHHISTGVIRAYIDTCVT